MGATGLGDEGWRAAQAGFLAKPGPHGRRLHAAPPVRPQCAPVACSRPQIASRRPLVRLGGELICTMRPRRPGWPAGPAWAAAGGIARQQRHQPTLSATAAGCRPVDGSSTAGTAAGSAPGTTPGSTHLPCAGVCTGLHPPLWAAGCHSRPPACRAHGARGGESADGCGMLQRPGISVGGQLASAGMPGRQTHAAADWRTSQHPCLPKIGCPAEQRLVAKQRAQAPAGAVPAPTPGLGGSSSQPRHKLHSALALMHWRKDFG